MPTFVVRSGVARRPRDACGQPQSPMQILVVHLDDMLKPRHECALDAAMADLDAFCIIRHVDDAALALVRNLCFPGKRETQLFLTSPRDVPAVMAKLAAWTCE